MKQNKKLLVVGMIVGGFLTLGPLWGVIGTIIGMFCSFQEIGSGSGLANPTLLSKSIGTVLVSAAVGFMAFPLGLAILIPSIVFYSRLRKSLPPQLPINRA